MLRIFLKLVLASQNKLQPALFSAEAEQKVIYLCVYLYFKSPLISQVQVLKDVSFSSMNKIFVRFYQVLQHLMDGLVSLTFRPEDLHCSFFRYTVRELLACAVMRPVLNLASPRS